jgi:mono/diheme cytochrome c family protein
MFRASGWRGVLALCALLVLTGCTQKMADQPAVKPLAANSFFTDGQGARPLPPDTVPRDASVSDDLLNTGMIDGKEADLFPFPITKAILVRGQERFNIFCAVCHDRTGAAQGIVVQKGYAEPPILTSKRLMDEPAGHIFDVITNGFAATDQMPSYAAQIPVRDRWAIVAYIRALQLSQHATINDVPPDVRATLEAQP